MENRKSGAGAAERENDLNQRLRQLIQHAYQNAPAVKELMDKAGVAPFEIQSVKDLEKLPITRKDDFTKLIKAKPPFGGFLAVPIESLERIYISPGPMYEPGLSRLYEEVEKIEGLAPLEAAGFRQGDRIMITLSYHMSPGGLLLDKAARRLGATAIPTGVGNTELQIQIMRDLQVNGYMGTPSFLMTLIQKAEELGYDFRRDFSLRAASFVAEPLTPSLRRTFEQDYGINVSQGYGTAELGLLGYECRQKSGWHIADDKIVEIADPQTGKQLPPGDVGEVVVTSLNETYPLIRFGTGDLSWILTEPCPCGRTSHRLMGIEGRVGDETKVRGMFIHPRQVEEAISKFDQVSNFQVIVKRQAQRDVMTINLELKDEVLDKQKLANDLGAVFQEICRVRADKIEFVPRGTIPEKRKIVLDERTWE